MFATVGPPNEGLATMIPLPTATPLPVNVYEPSIWIELNG